MQRFCRRIGIRLYRPSYRLLRGDPQQQAEAKEELADLRQKAQAGELVLLSQDEARFPMVATLATALGVKGFRLAVGTRDCKDLLDVLGVVDVVRGAVQGTTMESSTRAKQKTGKSKTRRMQEAFAALLRHVSGGSTRPISTRGWCWSSTAPHDTGASRSTRRWPITGTWS